MSLSLRTPSATTITAIKAIVFFLCLLPAVNLALGWRADALGANPIETITRASGEWVRSDLSCTVFLSEPDSYDGGELVVHDTYGQHTVKLPAGHAVLYPGTSLHEVRPVTRGVRWASFFWVQSLVRSDEQRRLLFDMDMNLLRLRTQHGESPETTALTGTYHNLLRLWADA